MSITLLLLATGSAFCFALALVLTQRGLRSLPPLAGACISVPTTAAIFLLLSPVTVRLDQWHGGSALLFAAVGIFFPAAVTLLTYAANRQLGPNVAGALGNLSPLFAVGMAVVLLGELPGVAQMLGIVAICGGVALLFAGRGGHAQAVPLLAFGLPIAAALVRGVVQPAVKLGLQDWPNSFAAATIGYVVSAVLIVVAGAARRVRFGEMRRSSGLPWFAAVGVSNGLAVVTLYLALERGPVAVVAPLVACYPLFTLVLNWLVLGDRQLSRWVGAGVVLSVAGVVLLLLR